MMQEWLNRFDGLQLRERLLTGGLALLIVFVAADVLFLSPIRQSELNAQKQVEQLQMDLRQLETMLEEVSAGLNEGEELVAARRLSALKAELGSADEKLLEFQDRLIDPADMASVLQGLMQGYPGLVTESATNLPPRPIPEEQDPAASETERLYQHTLELAVRGRYLDFLQYLRAIEALPWYLNFTALEIETEEFPENRIVLRVQSMSLSEEYLGV